MSTVGATEPFVASFTIRTAHAVKRDSRRRWTARTAIAFTFAAGVLFIQTPWDHDIPHATVGHARHVAVTLHATTSP